MRRGVLLAVAAAGLAAAAGVGALLVSAERTPPPAVLPDEPAEEDPSVGGAGGARDWEHRGQTSFAGLEKRRRAILEAASRVAIDGELRDWEGIPSIPSAEVLGPGDAARRILAVALAPTTERLRAMVATTGDVAGSRIWLEWDRTADTGFESRVEVDPDGSVSLYARPPGGRDRVRRRVEATASRGKGGLEISIPASVLGPSDRGWARMRAFVADRDRKIVERGPCIASYLLDRPIAVPPPPAEEACATAPPVLGRWFVAQGPFGRGSHEGTFAYDLGIRDARHEAGRVAGSDRAEDSYCWGQAVVVRDFAKVLDAQDGIADHATVGRLEDRAGPANLLQVRLASGWNLLLAHLRRESVIVARGESVRAFTKVGSVGNSGKSTGPHLHLAANGKSTWPRGAPVRFVEVVVGLNAFDGDPWACYRESWDVEEGFFFSYVER